MVADQGGAGGHYILKSSAMGVEIISQIFIYKAAPDYLDKTVENLESHMAVQMMKAPTNCSASNELKKTK